MGSFTSYVVYYVILDVHRNNPLHQIVVFDLGGITYFTRENQFPVSWSADEEALDATSRPGGTAIGRKTPAISSWTGSKARVM